MNFKRGYPKEKKDVEWKTPRYIQMGNDYPIEEETPKWRSEKRYKCKKLKGDHDFIEFRRETLSHWREREMVEFQCIGCGKKKIVFEP